MLQKIIAVRNVGRFLNSALPGNPTLAKYTFIFGGNGFGKTTLCAVLRSLSSGDAAYILGRRTLGSTADPKIQLLTVGGIAAFQDGMWSQTVDDITVYDGQFIAENVHSGDVVDLEHKRAFYRVIVGKEGAALAQEDERLAIESSAKTRDVSLGEKAVQTYVPIGLSLDEFLKLPYDPNIDHKIAEQDKSLNAFRQSGEIQSRAMLREVAVPELPSRAVSLLAQSLEGIAGDTERRVLEHLATHGMNDRGEAWLGDGVPHIVDETCPFCGQSVRGLPLITAYRGLFSAAYDDLKADIQKVRKEIDQAFGDRAIGAINTLVEQNRGHVEFWIRYCALSADTLAVPEGLTNAFENLCKTTRSLLDQKARAPLDTIKPDGAFTI